MDNKTFFETIYSGGRGKAVIVLPNYQGKPTQDHWFNYPEDIEKMVAFVDEKRTGSVWYSPDLFKTEERVKGNAVHIAVAAADADTCEPDLFRVRPTLAVQTSEDRWHVYWVLEEGTYTPEEVAKLNRRIAQVHKNQGCDTSFVNSAKLLRVPGTSNHKHPGAVVIVSEYDDELSYTYEYLNEQYPVSETPDAIVAVDTPAPDDLAEYIEKNRAGLLVGLPNSIALRSMLFERHADDKRSDVRYKLLCELYRLDLDDRAVVAIAWGAPSNKYRTEDPRGARGLWAEAMKAKQEILDESELFDKPIGQEVETESGTGGGKPKKVGFTSFLTEQEKQEIAQLVNFIDQWIQWAGTRTDAPAEYHRAAAITLLSTIYSQFGHIKPKPGKIKLNIWIMVLGRSTKDRKSTTRGYLQQALRALTTEEYVYELGDDVTPGGLSLALHDRANKPSTYIRDEVQGFFKEVLGQSYMSGALEAFTKLYDGWSGGRLRASGDKKSMESVPVSFIMFLMGILTETTEVLTVTNFRSGFLARFLYVIGSRPEGYVAPPLEEADDDEDGEDDKVFRALMAQLSANRDYWAMYGGDGETYRLKTTEESLARYQQFEADMANEAMNTPYAEIISTTCDRLAISTFKVAAILAMDDRSKVIEMRHMLQAIEYAGEWFDNTVSVASMVSESEWQRDVDKLEQFISSKGGRTTYTMAYRNFKNKRPFEFEEMISALETRGAITRVQAGNKWVLEIKRDDK